MLTNLMLSARGATPYGFIKVRFKLGEGGGFQLYFPMVNEANYDEEQVMLGQQAVVFIVGDNMELSKALRSVVASVGYQVQIFDKLEVFFAAYQSERGCVVSDVRMSGISGLEFQKALLERHIFLPIIFITDCAEAGVKVEEMKRGAINFLEKPVNDQALIDSINRALGREEECYVCQEEKRALLNLTSRLTHCELGVMRLMVQGKSTKTVADELGISPNAVALHRAKVMKKMQVKTLEELVTLSVKCQLLGK